MRTPFDQFGKQMIHDALAPGGVVETDAEVPVDTRRVDVWFLPDPARSARADLGLLGRMAEGPATFELFHDTPDGPTVAECVIKHGNFRHFLSLRDPPPPLPTLWVVSSGRPQRAIEGLGMSPAEGWPAGCYLGPALLWSRLCVVSELPDARETLLLRLLGAGRVLGRAVAELMALPAGAPERTLSLPLLLRLQIVVTVSRTKRTGEEEVDMEMAEHDVAAVEEWTRLTVERGVARGVVQGAVETRRQDVIDAYEIRFGVVPEDLRAAVQAAEDAAKLRAWHRLAVAGTAEEIAAAIRGGAGC